MPTTNQPFGMDPVRHINGKFMPPPRSIPDGIASGYANNIYFGSPVTMSTNGTLVISTSNQDIYGVFAGCKYVPDNTSMMNTNMQWTSAATYVAGTMVAMVWDDPNIIYEIQSNGAIASTAVGAQADFVNANSGQQGRSVATISSGLVAAGSQGQLRIVGLSNRINNAWGDTYTIVEAMIARQQYTADKVSI